MCFIYLIGPHKMHLASCLDNVHEGKLQDCYKLFTVQMLFITTASIMANVPSANHTLQELQLKYGTRSCIVFSRYLWVKSFAIDLSIF